jgi:hypothetical protein
MRLTWVLLGAMVVAVTGCSGSDDGTPSRSAPTSTTVARSSGDIAACGIFEAQSEESERRRAEIEAADSAPGMGFSFLSLGYRDAADGALERADDAELMQLLVEARRQASEMFETTGIREPGDLAILEQTLSDVDAVFAWCADPQLKSQPASIADPAPSELGQPSRMDSSLARESRR